MKFKAHVAWVIVFFVMAISSYCSGYSLDGTSNVVYKTNHQVFHDGDTAQGFVDLAKGFTVGPVASGAGSTHGANMFMDTCVTVSDAIDLRGTSTITLLRDLYLDDGVTFSDSGKIYSYGNALVMKGDLSIPDGKVLHCGGKLIIDGNGHTLHMGSGSQLFLDNTATLTLRNMVIETKHTYPGQSALMLSSNISKLALDNVMLSLGDDFYVNRGQLFFHNDVMVTGTSAFVYRSTVPSYIASHGSLMFDNGTTFSYAPATPNRNLIVMSDASSTLALNGCTLKTTHTGLRLTKGRLYFDNHVTVNGVDDNMPNATTPIRTPAASASTLVWPVSTSWSPDGQHIAVANNGANDTGTGGDTLQVFSFSGTTLVDISGGGAPTDQNTRSVSWSPDGNYIAAVNYGHSSTGVGGNTLQVFSFSGGTIGHSGTPVGSVQTGINPSSVSWSPDGNFIAVVNSSSNTLQVFSFSGGTPISVGSASTGTNPSSVSWSSDGNHIAVVNGGSTGSNGLMVFSFTGGTPVNVMGSGSGATTGSGPSSVSWSPDGNYIAVANQTSGRLQVFSFTGGIPTNVSGDGAFTNGQTGAVSWSPDGNYIAVVNGNSDFLLVFSFTGGTPVDVSSNGVSTGRNPWTGVWSPDGNYIAVANMQADSIWVFTINYQPDTSQPKLSNCITFGNSAAGSAADLEVHVGSGATVEINGNVLHDAA